MASYSMEEFLGEGVLKGLVPKLLAGGWDDVPTIKMMNADDMDWMKLTRQQKDALEIRTYLHDRSLMQYADPLESSGKSLAELLSMSTVVLSSQFGMKRGHVARFIDRASACGVTMPPSYVLPARERSTSSISKNSTGDDQSTIPKKSPLPGSSRRSSIERSAADFKIKEGYTFKGIVAAEPAEPRLCGLIPPPPVVDDVAPYSVIENISVQKLTPEYKVGMERLVTTKAPPMKASDLWLDKPAILLCIRRPGCVMCRADAHQIYARKAIFDALGFQLIAVLHEQIESEVKDFWPRYWGGTVILDPAMNFYKALGGGELMKDTVFTGFLFNRRVHANFKRAKATGMVNNLVGNHLIKGGLFVIGSGGRGVAYQFIERNFGDWAPIAEVIEICSKMQNELTNQEASI